MFEPVDFRCLRLRIARVDDEMERAVEEGRLRDAQRLAHWQVHLIECLMYGNPVEVTDT